MRARADAGDQWNLGSWVGQEEWAWSESESSVCSAADARAVWRAKLSRRGVLSPTALERLPMLSHLNPDSDLGGENIVGFWRGGGGRVLVTC